MSWRPIFSDGFIACAGSWYTIDASVARKRCNCDVVMPVTSSPATSTWPPTILPLRGQVAQRRVRRGGLAATALADEAVCLARGDAERHAAQHGTVDAAHGVDDLEVFERECGRGGGGGECRGHDASNTDCTESAMRLAAITRLAIAAAGKTVVHQMSGADRAKAPR